MGSSVKITPVKNFLGRKLHKPGGIGRTEALEAAGKNVESLRDEFVGAIPGEIAALEAMVAEAGYKHIHAEELEAMLRRAGQILTLSGTYGYDLLDQVVKRFCDLAAGMIDKNVSDLAPVSVHLRAMRLLCPGGPELSETEADHILGGLARVQAHYGIAKVSQDDQTA